MLSSTAAAEQSRIQQNRIPLPSSMNLVLFFLALTLSFFCIFLPSTANFATSTSFSQKKMRSGCGGWGEKREELEFYRKRDNLRTLPDCRLLLLLLLQSTALSVCLSVDRISYSLSLSFLIYNCPRRLLPKKNANNNARPRLHFPSSLFPFHSISSGHPLSKHAHISLAHTHTRQTYNKERKRENKYSICRVKMMMMMVMVMS